MRRVYDLLISWCVVLMVFPLSAQKRKVDEQMTSEYVILTSVAVKNDTDWMEVVNTLQEKHQAKVLFYEKSQRENLDDLKRLMPRYVAIVDKPENIGRKSVMDFHKLSRELDDDIYEDFLWGIITGYDATSAMRMVNNSTEPLVIHDAIASITELSSAKWFDRYGWVDDHTEKLWGEKEGKGESVVTRTIKGDVSEVFADLYTKYNPDLIVTAFHASEMHLQMPYSGYFSCSNGKLIGHSASGDWELKDSGKRKVYFAVGNCLIGNVNNTRNSMAIAWMNGANATVMVGYVVPTWHGRAGWGSLKYWLTTPGRYNLAEAFFLNQQDFLHQQYQWYPELMNEDYPFEGYFYIDDMAKIQKRMKEVLGREPSNDEIGFWHDRDVLVYYGDPKWNVRLQELSEENDFTVSSKIKGEKCVITIKTKNNFNLQRMKGDKFKQEHVLDLPFSYFFPQRLKSPHLAKGQDWEVALDENFLLIYNCDFEPNKTYQVILNIEK